MTPRAGKEFRRSAQADDLTVTHRHAAGIDVHSREHFAAADAECVRMIIHNRLLDWTVGVHDDIKNAFGEYSERIFQRRSRRFVEGFRSRRGGRAC